jgi:hypothetical protein
MKSLSNYGGIAAVTVLGVGLLIVGKPAAGLAALGLACLALAVTALPTAAGKVFSRSLAALICSALFAYFATSNEISGTASYQPGTRGPSVTVTRRDSPSKFHEITHFRWGMSGFLLLASVAGFIFCRRLNQYSDDFV